MNTLKKILWFFWPVHKEETAKTLPLLVVFFLVSFIYSVLRSLKVTILLSEPELQGQAASYLKVFAIMPAAIFFTWLTGTFQTHLGQRKTFTSMVTLFGLLFALLILVILPNKDAYQLHIASSNQLINLINYWYITIFYVVAEMWSSIVLNVLCWGIIIEITQLKESKRLYALFALSANFATFVAGWWASASLETQVRGLLSGVSAVVDWFAGTGWSQKNFVHLSNLESLRWEDALLYQMLIVWVIQVFIIIIFRSSMTHQPKENQTKLETKVSVGFIESVKVAFSNPIIRSVALMMISYNIIYHMIDVFQMAYLKQTFSKDLLLMNRFLNYITQLLGVFSIIFSWTLSGTYVRRFGLAASLWLTPIIWVSMSALDVFGHLIGQKYLPFTWEGVAIPVSLASLSVILSLGRAIKFTIFDTSRDMSFLSLSQQEKRQGKAAIDGLTSRFGKTGGAWLVILLVGQSGHVLASVAPLTVSMFAAYLLWFYSVHSLIKALPKEYLEISAQEQA